MRLRTLFSFKAKVIEPCTKLLSVFKIKFEKPSISLRAPTFRMPKRRTKPRVRTKVVRFRKPFSIRALSFPRCSPKAKFRLRKRRPSLSSKVKRTFHFRRKKHAKPPQKPVPKVRVAQLLTVLFSLRKAKEVDTDSSDQAMGDASVSEGGHGKEPFPSPITPAYIRKSVDTDSKKESSNDLEVEDVEDACKSFENYLVEMIVEEGKLKDLKDVEELLYCWRNLKSPVFIDLVCRFYGELSKDVFSTFEEEEGEIHETITSE